MTSKMLGTWLADDIAEKKCGGGMHTKFANNAVILV
jgi:hypothetical protein